uniref:Uncharacterized protein n=1 Tax=Ficedula albicollis TaxID=59894 RepID=A0A803VZN1_FICAL
VCVYIYNFFFLYCCCYAAFIWAGFINVLCGTSSQCITTARRTLKLKYIYIYILRKSIFDGCIQMLNKASDATCCVVYTCQNEH